MKILTMASSRPAPRVAIFGSSSGPLARALGITGNPLLCLDSEVDPSSIIAQIENVSLLSAQLRPTTPPIAEQPHPPESTTGPVSKRESSSPAL